MTVFIVLHHEIMGTSEDCWADEMVYYTCDSLKKAINLIRKSGVARWSWWEIQSQELNRRDWPDHVGYYGLRGGKLAKAPYEKCVELFRNSRGKTN